MSTRNIGQFVCFRWLKELTVLAGLNGESSGLRIWVKQSTLARNGSRSDAANGKLSPFAGFVPLSAGVIVSTRVQVLADEVAVDAMHASSHCSFAVLINICWSVTLHQLQHQTTFLPIGVT